MENYIVSARKYRPSTFDTVVGQSHVTTTLKNAIRENRLAQAFLFCGPRGVGKTTCARILAKTINCLSLTADVEACGKCASCMAFQNNASLNIYELDAASNNSVDDIRNLVEQVRFPPQVGKRKVYIIDEVHMLSTGAFNAFLKTLEEPPSYIIFILATTEKHKILPTILSRCQIFDFKRIEPQDISQHLQKIAQKENIEAEPEALDLIAQKADGGLRDALSIFDMLATFSNNRITYQNTIENLHILDTDYYFQMTDALLQQNHSQALLLFDKILKKGFDGHVFITGLAEHFRNLLVCKDEATIQLLETSPRVKQLFATQAKKTSMSFLLSALNLANQCDLNYKSSKNPKLHVELTLLKIAYLNAAISVAKGGSALQEIDEIEKKKPDTSCVTNSTPKNGQELHEPAPTDFAPKTTSIKQTPKISFNLQTTEPPQTQPNTQQQPKFDFNSDNVKDILRRLKLKLEQQKNREKDNKRYASFLQFLENTRLKIIEPYTIVFVYLEDEQQTIFQEMQEGLHKHFQESFGIRQIQVIAQKDEPNPQASKKTYTSAEKFEILLKKNTALQQLKDELGLEII
ncbi:MAG: DNA polymerase III subunit gamma/tau [Microscillaceae bacterium]|nr:DNA polymerase III subunit gamma/tau [Microscillaceae bacterium]MDW8461903.1 DNA polymerase III subunit gamma/tau [Cytophagales bacterium]